MAILKDGSYNHQERFSGFKTLSFGSRKEADTAQHAQRPLRYFCICVWMCDTCSCMCPSKWKKCNNLAVAVLLRNLITDSWNEKKNLFTCRGATNRYWRQSRLKVNKKCWSIIVVDAYNVRFASYNDWVSRLGLSFFELWMWIPIICGQKELAALERVAISEQRFKRHAPQERNLSLCVDI